MDKKFSAIWSGAAFYGSLALCLIAVAVGGWFLLFGQEEDAIEAVAPSYETVTDAAAPVEVPVLPVEPETPPVAEVIETVQPEAVAMPEEEIEDIPVVAEAPKLYVEPLQGDVVAAFSVDELMYDPTMEDWRIHCGVDIAAAEGTAVLAAASGTVAAVTEDVMLGTTVVIDHDNGYQTTYANLQSAPTVLAGDSVSAGTVIGAVGSTAAAESAREPHLHFAVTKDGDAVDPNEFLAQ